MKTCFGLLGLIIMCPDDKAPVVVSDYCKQAAIISPTKGEFAKLSDQLQVQLLAHNKKYRQHCEPKRMK